MKKFAYFYLPIFLLLLFSSLFVFNQTAKVGSDIVFETHPNPDCQTLHIRQRLTEGGVTIDVDRYEGTSLSQLYTNISRIPGVETVSFRDYKVYLVKGKAYSWEEVLPAVLTTIKHDVTENFTPVSVADIEYRNNSRGLSVPMFRFRLQK